MLSGSESPGDWLEGGVSMNALTPLQRQAVLLASRKNLKSWLAQAPSSEFVEFLESIPRSSKGPEVNIVPDFQIGGNQSGREGKIPKIYFEHAWQDLYEERNDPPRANEPLEESWERIFGKLFPLAREIEILDGYILTDLRRRPSAIKEIFELYISKCTARVTIHALTPSETESDLSTGAATKLAHDLRSHLSGAAKDQFSLIVYEKSKTLSGSSIRFPRDRYVLLGLDKHQIKVQLGHGLEIFDPRVQENALSEQPSFNWTERVRVPLSQLGGNVLVGSRPEFL